MNSDGLQTSVLFDQSSDPCSDESLELVLSCSLLRVGEVKYALSLYLRARNEPFTRKI